MTIKMYKNLDMENLLKFKALTMLGSLLYRNGDENSAQKIHETVLKGLSNIPEAYELVFAVRNYGYLLAKNDTTRLEGQDCIKKAEILQKSHPYWAERKLSLFVPVAATLSDEQYDM
jgi:hypothetical protein